MDPMFHQFPDPSNTIVYDQSQPLGQLQPFQLPLSGQPGQGGTYFGQTMMNQNYSSPEIELFQSSQASSISLGLSQGTLDQLQGMQGSQETPLLLPSFDEDLLGSVGPDMGLLSPQSIIGNKFGGKQMYDESQPKGNVAFGGEDEDGELDSSQSDGASQEGKIPSLNCDPGWYDFKVTLGQNMQKKTAVFSQHLNKLYCNDDIKILFNIHFDTEKMKGKNMKSFFVMAQLVFTENTHIMNPVKRCFACLNKEAAANGIKFADVDENSEYHHVVRARDNKYAVHGLKHNRYFAIAPLENPQPGSEGIISRNYEFKCKNTCLERKQLSLIFTLLENDKPVGKTVMALKVCTCPQRDYKIDLKKSGDKRPQNQEKDGRKRKAEFEEEQKLEVPELEKQRCGRSGSPPPMGGLSIKCEPGLNPNEGETGHSVKPKKHFSLFSQSQSQSEMDDNDNDSEMDSQGPSQASQESFCSRTIEKLKDDVKLFYKMKKTGDETEKIVADTAFRMLKGFHRTAEKVQQRRSSSAQRGEGTPSGGSGQDRQTEHGSPDSGVNAKTP